MRKVTGRSWPAGVTRKEERIYLGGFEIYREYEGDGTTSRWSARRCTSWTTSSASRWSRRARSKGRATGSPAQLIRYQFGNHLGSASLELDDQAQIISYEEYYPVRQHVVSGGAQPDGNAEAVSLHGQGAGRGERAVLSRGTILRAPLGRWISYDAKGIDEAPNLYIYVNDNPVALVDRNGREGADWQDELTWKERFALAVDDLFGANKMQAAANASAGYGDYLSFGLSEKARQALGSDSVVDKSSDAYLNGATAGAVHQFALSVASLPAAAAKFGWKNVGFGVLVGIPATMAANAGLNVVDESGTASATLNTLLSLAVPARLAGKRPVDPSAPEVLPPEQLAVARSPNPKEPLTIDIYPNSSPTSGPVAAGGPANVLALPPGKGGPPVELKGGGAHEVGNVSTPRVPGQSAIMGGSAKDLAGRPDAQHLHLVALCLGGAQATSNLALASEGVNYNMLPLSYR